MTPAPWPRRIGALFVDWLLAVTIVGLFTGRPLFSPADAEPLTWTEAFLPFAVYWVMATLLTGTIGFTLGKRLFRLAVVDPDGRAIGIGRAAIRSALVCLVLPAVLLSENRRGLQDLAAGSMVIEVPRP